MLRELLVPFASALYPKVEQEFLGTTKMSTYPGLTVDTDNTAALRHGDCTVIELKKVSGEWKIARVDFDLCC